MSVDDLNGVNLEKNPMDDAQSNPVFVASRVDLQPFFNFSQAFSILHAQPDPTLKIQIVRSKGWMKEME